MRDAGPIYLLNVSSLGTPDWQRQTRLARGGNAIAWVSAAALQEPILLFVLGVAGNAMPPLLSLPPAVFITPPHGTLVHAPQEMNCHRLSDMKNN
jgi:hypothetical protein